MVLAAASTEVFAKGLPKQIVDTLNFALTLEHIEDAFYRSALAKHFIPKEHLEVFKVIGHHESEHVRFLTGALGSAAGKKPKADFTAGGKYADVFSNFETFLTLSQTFEDLGVAAYKGKAGNLIKNDDILTAALQIHSVEARHAAAVRRIGGKKSWDGALIRRFSSKVNNRERLGIMAFSRSKSERQMNNSLSSGSGETFILSPKSRYRF